MLETEFKNFQYEIVNFIHIGKLPAGMTMDKIIRTIDGLELSQKVILKRRLESERRSLYIVEPNSFPPYFEPIFTHGSDALKRACIVFCLAIAANAAWSPVFSIGSALIRAAGVGCTIFGASIAYDNSKCTLGKKYERVIEIQNILDKYHLEPQQEPERPRLIFSR